MIVCHQNDVCENYIGNDYVGGYCGPIESGLCVFVSNCVKSDFLWLTSLISIMHNVLDMLDANVTYISIPFTTRVEFPVAIAIIVYSQYLASLYACGYLFNYIKAHMNVIDYCLR